MTLNDRRGRIQTWPSPLFDLHLHPYDRLVASLFRDELGNHASLQTPDFMHHQILPLSSVLSAFISSYCRNGWAETSTSLLLFLCVSLETIMKPAAVRLTLISVSWCSRCCLLWHAVIYVTFISCLVNGRWWMSSLSLSSDLPSSLCHSCRSTVMSSLWRLPCFWQCLRVSAATSIPHLHLFLWTFRSSLHPLCPLGLLSTFRCFFDFNASKLTAVTGTGNLQSRKAGARFSLRLPQRAIQTFSLPFQKWHIWSFSDRIPKPANDLMGPTVTKQILVIITGSFTCGFQAVRYQETALYDSWHQENQLTLTSDPLMVSLLVNMFVTETVNKRWKSVFQSWNVNQPPPRCCHVVVLELCLDERLKC